MARRFPAAGEGGRVLGVVHEAGLAEGDGDARLFVVVVEDVVVLEAFEEDVLDGQAGGEDGILGDVADADAFADGAVAGVGLFDAGDDFHERRFAGAVGTDEADVVALEEGEGEVVEEGARGVGLGEALAG